MDQKENAIVANGNMIRLLYSDTPEDVGYSAQVIRILQHISGLELPYFPK